MALLQQARKHRLSEFNTQDEVKENCFPAGKYIRYDIASILRCHSKENNPQDASTRVNDVAYALDGTNMCATCGVNIINIVDVSTGKVLQRFNDDFTFKGHKEVFFRLQWTRINEVNILAAAGLHGQIKVIIPKISSCVLRISAHEGQIDSLIFHPKYPHVLISGSYDNKIQFWKLNIDENLARDGFNVNDLEFKYDHLGTIELNKVKTNFQDHVLSMCFVHDNLVVNTVFNNYYIGLKDFKPYGSFMESCQPGQISPNTGKDDAVSYMTSSSKSPRQTNKCKFKAEVLEIFNESGEELMDKGAEIGTPNLMINKMAVLDNKIVADVLNTNSIYLFKTEHILEDSPTSLMTRRRSPEAKQSHKIRFIVEKVFNIAEELSAPNTGMCFFKDVDRYYVIKTTEKGFFYKFELNVDKMRKGGVMKFKIPDEYTIKLQKTLKKIPVNNYGLTEPMKIINCAVQPNSDTIVCVTSQNMVVIWKKCD